MKSEKGLLSNTVLLLTPSSSKTSYAPDAAIKIDDTLYEHGLLYPHHLVYRMSKRLSLLQMEH